MEVVNNIYNKHVQYDMPQFILLVDGIPHASIWINDTVNGVNGTFIPLNNPAVQGERMYVLAGFKPWNNTIQENVFLRLFTISVRDSEINRIKIEWFHDFILPSGVTIPYIHSSETVCSTRAPPTSHGNNDEGFGTNINNFDYIENDSEPIADIAVETDSVIVVFNCHTGSFKGSGNESIQGQKLNSKIVVVQDQGTRYSVKYTKTFEHPFQSVAVDSSTPNVNDGTSRREESVWISFYDSSVNQSALMSLGITTGEVMSHINISNILGTKIARITSKMTFLHHQRSLVKANMINPLVFGVLIDNSKSVIISLDTASVLLLWSLDQDDRCIGQISTVDRARDSLLVMSNTVGVSVYLLTKE